MVKLKVAVIGIGNMGQHHARSYFNLPQANLIAVCDVDQTKGKALADKYQCLYYSDYKKMLSEQKLDAVSIAVPTSLHDQVAGDVLDKKINVLLEKPIAFNLAKAKKIILKAKEKKCKLMIGLIERFNPAVQELKKLIVDNRLGKIVSINTKRVGGLPPQIKDANVVIDLAVHDIDISNYLLGEYPRKVYGFKSKNIISDREDSAVILLTYANTTSFIEVNWVTPVKIRTMDITGTKAFARLDYINQTLSLYENLYLKQDNQYADFKEFIAKFSQTKEIKIPIKKQEPLYCELEEFLAAIIENREPSVTGEEAYQALAIALKI